MQIVNFTKHIRSINNLSRDATDGKIGINAIIEYPDKNRFILKLTNRNIYTVIGTTLDDIYKAILSVRYQQIDSKGYNFIKSVNPNI